ncbi:MAG: zinc ribbon domain-containing protein [Gammaproteobacteria bacterium]|nr:zinc ribbon domain-containing protein [Gammaproteobacteria bacterium]
MPTYDYLCTRCGTRFEAGHPVQAPTPACPACAGEVRQLITAAPAVHGYMARGRELAARSLEPETPRHAARHGHDCPCCREAGD